MDHSFVIPAYKQSPYIEECIVHLLNQTIKSEIILTTSTPSAYLEQLAGKYQLPYFINNATPGIAQDWNFALSKATTPLVTIAHQDDVYAPFFTEAVIKAYQRNKSKNVQLTFTNYHDIVEGKKRKFSVNAIVKQLLLLPFMFSDKVKTHFFKKTILSFGDPICCPAVTLNREQIGQFKFDEQLTCVLDWFAWYELANQKGTFVYIKEKLVSHRIHTASETAAQIALGKRAKEEYMMFEKIWGKTMAKILLSFYRLGHKENT